MVSDRLKRTKGSSLMGSLLLVLMAIWASPGLCEAQAAAPSAPKQARALKAKKMKKPAAKKVAAPATAKKAPAAGETARRDPFYIPPAVKPGAEGEIIVGPLPPGKRGLVPSQLKLEGIVRMEAANSMIAVVANAANRAYFLRENDEVYNGVVTKITLDSVLFTEKYRDAEGRESTREVVKRLAPAPGVNR